MKRVTFFLLYIFLTLTIFAQSMVVQKNDGSNLFIDLSSINKINFIIPCPNLATVDYAGKTYNTVQIGSQCWLKENLDVGTMVNGGQGQYKNGLIEKFCYNDDANNCAIYGGLYTWNEAMQYVTNEGAQGICPNGWHIPTVAEYQAFATALSHDGNAIKAIGEGSGGGAGTNTSGFGALLTGGKSYNSSSFTSLGDWGGYWASHPGNCWYTCAYTMHLTSNDDTVIIGEGAIHSWGMPVRCIKD
jgi:uncharacterized protein (TIGR02145 family)